MKNAGLCANGAKVYSEQGLEKKKKTAWYIYLFKETYTLCYRALYQ